MTTIQVDQKTLKTLAALKQDLRAKSYQEVLEILVSERKRVPRSLFGLAKGFRPYTREKEVQHDL